VKWRRLHNEELHDLHFRYFDVREGAKRVGYKTVIVELRDLHSRYCGVREGANRGVEKTA